MHVLVEMDNSGLVPLLEADRYEDLARMYQLLKRVVGGLHLVQQVRRKALIPAVGYDACLLVCTATRVRVLFTAAATLTLNLIFHTLLHTSAGHAQPRQGHRHGSGS